MEFKDLKLKDLVQGIKEKQFTSESLVKYCIEQAEKYEHLNAIIEIFDDVLLKAKEIDKKVERGEKLGKLAGIPVAIKDNILYKGKRAGCASKFMQDFVSPYNATLVKKLLDEDAIIFARTNMDEFAMGGSCENSCYGVCKNAIDSDCVAGGSSGGSAVCVSAGICPVAIGTDTGGSIRQPSSFNGVVGIKPTYGTVSRYGIVAFASSTDQASPITKTVEDNKYMLEIIAGKDSLDATSIESDFGASKIKDKYVIGICKQLKEGIEKLEQYSKFKEAIDILEKAGHKIVEVDIEHIKNSLACYYIISPAEATSNLARFDGVKYTTRSKDAKTLEELYIKSRSEGFGKEVQRRIILGNYVLSSGYFDAYYKKAKRVQELLKKEFERAFEKCDVIITPTTAGEAFEIGGKISDPVSMYLEDLFTVPASLAGIPAISVPYSLGKKDLPLGLQFMSAEKTEAVLYDLADKFLKLTKGGK
ncbi:MAG: Asp-tRNA(Asn)/Glu-tRNA(Gln) amidotransferase subunit GatA [Clostridiales bacterium]|nr:Asp-tRNA(Asn)/Glu-tRNA(Gln) amidotransferase subunit GatA [Clostridiales bacterium]